jgi:hypothetical protein
VPPREQGRARAAPRRAGRGGRGHAAARAGEGGVAPPREQGKKRGRAQGERRGGRGRERGEGRGAHLGIQLRRSPSPKPRAPREVEREMGERGCCAGIPNERGRGGGAWGGGQGRQGRAGRAGPGWARLGRATSRIETHDTHVYQTDSSREPKTETERDEHATSDKEMRFGMMQHP